LIITGTASLGCGAGDPGSCIVVKEFYRKCFRAARGLVLSRKH
jgi:hypothetical protein